MINADLWRCSGSGLTGKCRVFLLLCGLWVSFSCGAQNTFSMLEQASQQISGVGELTRIGGQLEMVLSGEIAGTNPGDLVSAADTLGNLTSKARDLGADARVFQTLLSYSELLSQRSRDTIRRLETASGEDESALENLYRSDRWYDINYALSAAVYWKAWAALAYAGKLAEGDERVVWLNRADSGFKVASVRILYPGIVHGSWLGLGYVAQARGDLKAAENRFRRLAEALAGQGENSVRKLAEAELTMMAIRQGELAQLTVLPRDTLTPSLAGVVIEEAFLLLERHRQTGSGAIPAGQRLKKVIADGFLTDALLNRILSYRDEIVGQDLGVVSLLVDAEFAYAYQQYLTTVLKYKRFRKAGGESLGFDTSPFQYHYAVAAMKTDLPQEARNEIGRLQRATNLYPGVAKALPKFAFSLAQLNYQQRPDKEHGQQLLRTAKNYILTSPNDADIAQAHLALAELSDKAGDAERHLRAARVDSRLKNDVALAMMRREIQRFNQAVITGNVGTQRDMAERILSSLGDLDRRKRQQRWYRAVAIQMRTVLGRDLSKLLREADQLLSDATQADDTRVRSVLYWSKLRILDTQGDEAALENWIAGLTEVSARQQVYQFLLEKEQAGDYVHLVNLANVFYPNLQGQVQDQRQVRLLQIRALSALGRSAEAFELARKMVSEFGNSGDAWQTYAEMAEESEHWFEAERAWARIVSATPEGAPLWRQAITRQIELLGTSLSDTEKQSGSSSSGRNACQAIVKLAAYAHLLEPGEQRVLQQRQEHCD